MKSEPIVTVATITAAAVAVIGLLVSFAVPITADQQTAILAFVAVAAPLIVIFARKWTRPEAEVVAAVVPLPTGGTEIVAGPAAANITDGTPVRVTPA